MTTTKIINHNNSSRTQTIIQLPNLNSPNINTLSTRRVLNISTGNTNYNLPTTIFKSFTFESPLLNRTINTPNNSEIISTDLIRSGQTSFTTTNIESDGPVIAADKTMQMWFKYAPKNKP